MEQLSKGQEKGTMKDTRAMSHSGADDESQIKHLLDRADEAFKAKDLNKIMALYADDVIAYDMMPPLQYKGKDAYRKAWEKGFAGMGSIDGFERRDLHIAVGGEIAIAHYLCNMKGSMKDGKKMDCWTRYTGGFRKVGDRWLIAHEQYSVPLDMQGEKPLWDLKPEDESTMQ